MTSGSRTVWRTDEEQDWVSGIGYFGIGWHVVGFAMTGLKYDLDTGGFSREESITFVEPPKQADWQCHLFGSDPTGKNPGMVYRPNEFGVPNRFVRWMMKICLGCTWEKLS